MYTHWLASKQSPCQKETLSAAASPPTPPVPTKTSPSPPPPAPPHHQCLRRQHQYHSHLDLSSVSELRYQRSTVGVHPHDAVGQLRLEQARRLPMHPNMKSTEKADSSCWRFFESSRVISPPISGPQSVTMRTRMHT